MFDGKKDPVQTCPANIRLIAKSASQKNLEILGKEKGRRYRDKEIQIGILRK
jgi:hypothetical protein